LYAEKPFGEHTKFLMMMTTTTFTKLMNMPSPPTRRNFTKIQNKELLPVVKQVANDNLMKNVMNVKDSCGNEKGECGISLDGTWQRWCHVSHNDVVTTISLDTKKVLDVKVLYYKCQACQKWQKKQNDPKYQE
jgi:hypothetical protein